MRTFYALTCQIATIAGQIFSIRVYFFNYRAPYSVLFLKCVQIVTALGRFQEKNTISLFLRKPTFRLSRNLRMSATHFRRCANVKSRAHTDVQCQYTASVGDFCHRHHKKPVRFFASKRNEVKIPYTRSQTTLALVIQKWWKAGISERRWLHQGPAVHLRSIAQNDTEVYSMEPIASIPLLFFFSYADSTKTVWAFDIRSLIQLFAQGNQLQNPYTRELFTERAAAAFRKRHDWLRERKYALLYGLEEAITPEQEWNHKVLDLFMKIEALGYLLSTSWFQDMRIQEHKLFYRKLYQLWSYRLGISAAEKEDVCPGWQQNQTRLFRYIPDDVERSHHDLRWWRRLSFGIIQSLVTRGASKSVKGLGALYVLMGLVQVSDDAAEAYPWIMESVE